MYRQYHAKTADFVNFNHRICKNFVKTHKKSKKGVDITREQQ